MKLTHGRSIMFAAAVSALLMFSVTYYWPIQEAYHPLNPNWNGCSKIANTTQNTTLLLSYNKPLATARSVLAIIGPSTNFTKDESSKIANFLESGGIVLLADDFGTGNSLLEALSVSVRFSNKPLADLYYYSKGPNFPVITDFSASPVTHNLTSIVLNRPSYIAIGNSSSVTKIGSSSPFSFIDYGGEGKPLANETIESYPVLVSVNIDRGLLILVADPSMFINDMIDLYGNMQLFQNLLRIGGGSVIFDTAHLAKPPLTDWRIMLKDGFDSLRSGKEAVYIPLIVVTILLLTFSFQLLKLSRSRRMAK